MKYDLYRGNVVLGTIDHTTDDFPFHHGVFEPTPEYAAVRELFEKEHQLLEAGRMEEWQKVRDKLDEPVLILKPVGAGKEVKKPLLHIDGVKAWWR